MRLTEINVVIAIVSGIIGIYTGYRRALSEASKSGENDAKIIMMLESHKEILDKMDKKLEDSAHDRRDIRETITSHAEQLKTLFGDVEEIKTNCKECRKKCD